MVLHTTFTVEAEDWVFFVHFHLLPFLTNLIVSLCVIGRHNSWKNFIFSKKSPDGHCAIPRSSFNHPGLPLPLFLNSYFLPKIQRCLNKGDNLNRFWGRNLECVSLSKASKYCQTTFADGRSHCYEKIAHITGRHYSNRGQKQPDNDRPW